MIQESQGAGGIGRTDEHGRTISDADVHPFEQITLHRIRIGGGEPTHWYYIEGLRQDGERSCRVHYQVLFDQADAHLRWHHGRSSETASTAEWSHAVMRAAVAFLID